MQTLHAFTLTGVVPVRYPIIQSAARNQWIDVNNESAVTLTVSLGGRVYLIPPNTTARYAMDNTETFVSFTPNSAANGSTDSVSGTIYNEQDSIPADIERGANAADILPITTADIIDGAVTAAKVATGAIGTNQLANGAVTNPILASLAVANSNIQALAVDTANIANGAVATTKIANLAVTTALIAGAAVGTAQIANAAITTALIANLAVTDALIANVSAGKITAGTISASISITAPTITGGLIQTASSGKRVALDATGINTDRVLFYGGNVSETSPGAVYNTGTLVGMVAPTITGFGSPAIFQVNSDGTATFSGSRINNSSFSGSTAMHFVGGGGEPAFQNSWTNYDNVWQNARFFIDAFDIVHLEGLVKNATNTTAVIFTLPVGYRPPAPLVFAVIAGGTDARLDVATNGDINISVYGTSGTAAYVSLSGISFALFN